MPIINFPLQVDKIPADPIEYIDVTLLDITFNNGSSTTFTVAPGDEWTETNDWLMFKSGQTGQRVRVPVSQITTISDIVRRVPKPKSPLTVEVS